MNSEILDIIVNEYEKQRSYNKGERDKRVEYIYSKYPEIKEIDDQINKTGRDTLRDILSNPDKKNLKRLRFLFFALMGFGKLYFI